MSDFSDTIARLSTNPTGVYAVRRKQKGGYIDGVAIESLPTALAIVASIQPADGKALQRLPDGLRTREVVTVWTSTPLLTETDTYAPDQVEYKGAWYQIEHVRDFSDSGNFFEATAVKVDA